MTSVSTDQVGGGQDRLAMRGVRYILESFETVPTVEEEVFFLEKTAAILEDIVWDVG